VSSDTARLETFADGVMAIAITLLILDVHVPPPSGRSLWSALAEEWPSYAGYVVSFLTIGIIWVNHHQMFKLIGRVTHGFLMMNVIFLMTIAFLPFPTALVADYIRIPDSRTAATVVYGLTMVAIAFPATTASTARRTPTPAGSTRETRSPAASSESASLQHTTSGSLVAEHQPVAAELERPGRLLVVEPRG